MLGIGILRLIICKTGLTLKKASSCCVAQWWPNFCEVSGQEMSFLWVSVSGGWLSVKSKRLGKSLI